MKPENKDKRNGHFEQDDLAKKFPKCLCDWERVRRVESCAVINKTSDCHKCI